MHERVPSSRVKLITFALAAFAAVCAGRLFQLQVVDHDTYALMASQEHLRKYEIPPERGQIYILDRGQKVPVALNRMLSTLFADPRYIQDPEQTANALAAVTNGDIETYRQKMVGESYYEVLERGVAHDVAAAIEELELPGIGLVDEPRRVYPEGTLASQILGYVNNDGFGQYGIEQYFDEELRGTPGLLDGKTDIRGIPIATADNVQIAPRPGQDIVLTIDRNIQAHVESVLRDGFERYRALAVSAVVMEADSGKVRAMANYPTFDPNQYQAVEDYSRFGNRVVSELYEPGSTFKLFTMAAGLHAGAVRPESRYRNQGYEVIDGHRVENAEFFGVREENMIDTIAHSVNTGVIYVLKRLGGGEISSRGKQLLHEYFVDTFRFGRPSGIELPAEPAGEIPPPAGISDVQYANMTFGQGLTATMLQLTAGLAAVVNGGTYYRPTVIEYLEDTDGKVQLNRPEVLAKEVVDSRTAKEIKDMMEAVVTDGGGFSSRKDGYRIGGKTGTAQIPNPDGGYFTDRDIGSFIGAAPLDDPRYVVLIRVDEPGYTLTGWAGSGAAGPMFAEIIHWLLNYDGIAPSR